MKLYLIKRWCLLVCLLAATGCAGRQGGLTLTIAHVNDTHGHLDPAPLSFRVASDTVSTQAAGFPRAAGALKQIRREHANVLFVHAGDAFQGSLYFSRFAGRADCNLLNSMGLDAMAAGNHEFDRGPLPLADFAARADFALLAANIDASREPLLKNSILPFTIKNYQGTKVGIIGIAAPDTAKISQPGQQLIFFDPETAAKKAIDALAARGVHAIVIVSHLGYQQDIALARKLPEIDVIAGGHSHSLLGDFSAVGLESEGPYPTICSNADNATVLIVQAWEWARVIGSLTVSFDGAGKVAGWKGVPLMPVGTSFQMEKGADAKEPASPEVLEKIQAQLARSPGIISIDEDAHTRTMLEPYSREIALLYAQKIARAPADIAHVRLPDRKYPAGSQLAPIVADAMLWKLRSMGIGAEAALTNAGAVRGALPRGDISIGQIEGLLPFEDTLVICRVSGTELKKILESGVDLALSADSGAFPYAAALRYTADAAKPAGKRILKIELQDASGRWRSLENKSVYRIVTNSYLARGGGGYTLFTRPAVSSQDTGFGDAEAFIEYAKARGEITCANDTRIQFLGLKK